MKKFTRTFTLFLVVCLCLTIFTACPQAAEHTVTIAEKGTGVGTLSVKNGTEEIESGDKVAHDTELTVTWTSQSGYTAKLFVNNTESTLTSPAKVAVEADITIEVRATAIPATEYTVTIQPKSTGVAGFSVKKDTADITSGQKVASGTSLTVTWAADSGFVADLYVNDTKSTATSPATITVTSNTRLEVRGTLANRDAVTVSKGLSQTFTEETEWDFAGSFSGNVDGTDVTPDVSLQLTLTRPTAENGIFTRVFKVQQLSGTAGDVQMLIYDHEGIYWDVLNNWQALTAHGTAFGTSLNAMQGYTGYWGSVEGNVLTKYTEGTNQATVSQTLNFDFNAQNAGEYLVTMDTYTFGSDTFTLAHSDSVLVTVLDAQALYSTVVGLKEFDTAGEFEGSFAGEVGGIDVEPNVELSLTLTRPTDADGTFTRVFKVQQLSGTAGDVQLLIFDDGGLYWDVLNNWNALTVHGAEFATNLHEMQGYTGYWGAVEGNTLTKYTEGTNQQTVSQTLEFEFRAENAGQYKVTMDTYTLNGEQLTLVYSHNIIVTVVEGDNTVVTTTGLKEFAQEGQFEGSFVGNAAGTDVEPNASFTLTLTRPTTADGIFTRVFKVEQLTGIKGGKVQLLAHDYDENYWDILNNWNALSVHETEFSTKLMAVEGYTGYWGAVEGNALTKYTEGTNQTTVSQTLDFEFKAENAGNYLITMDIYTLNGTALTLADSYSVLAIVK